MERRRREKRRTSSLASTLAAVLFMLSLTAFAQDEEVPSSDKMIWADSWLWTDAPDLDVAKWITDKPEMKDKFILVEFWRTWCGACKRMTPMMNELHKKYGDDLVVIAITGETEDIVSKYKGPKKDYFLALDKPDKEKKTDSKQPEKTPSEKKEADNDGPDTDQSSPNKRNAEQGALEKKFGVRGWPHCVLLEPEHRTVVWEGFPGHKGHELTVEKVGKYIEVGKKSSKKKK